MTKPATSSWEMGAAARITHLHREVRQAVSGICALSVDSGMNRSICGSTVSMLVISNTIGVRPCVLLSLIHKPFALLGYSYASDGIRIFGEGKQLDTTPQSFMLLSDGYARDDKHIFWGNRLVDADFDSFRVMEDGDAEDNYRYFFHGTMIKKKVQR